jgi:hypothetical protein
LYHDIARTRLEVVSFEGEDLPLATPQQRFRAVARLGQRLKAMDDEERERKLAALRALIGRTEVAPESPQAPLDWDEIRRLAGSGHEPQATN